MQAGGADANSMNMPIWHACANKTFPCHPTSQLLGALMMMTRYMACSLVHAYDII
jgi:hypothetical protein